MPARPRAAVDSSSSPLPLRTRDTVVLLTLARAATSAMVIGTGPSAGCHRRVSEPLPKPVPAVNARKATLVNGEEPLFVSREDNRVVWERFRLVKCGLRGTKSATPHRRDWAARCPMGHQ